ncbi:MAG TPA: hypothetical protein DDZ39_08680 [Flavobacteriaceae bacterium]|jgi:thiol-disulfide isomerase/thioredoxin|nr:hypothetical protein [Flavobacteriaceae bacterium]
MKKVLLLIAIVSMIACKNKDATTDVTADNKTSISDEKVALLTKEGRKPSPKFVDYENYKGGTTSLDDLKGKYVYIDVWATWCPPCRAEIPYLKDIEEEYYNENIAFVSISIDEDKAHEAWKNMIADKKMGGIQLFAGGDTEFVQGYRINSIPRFILIDDEGNIVNDNAPRPSEPALKTLFKSVGL